MKRFILIIFFINIGCNKSAEQNKKDIEKVEIGMSYEDVQTIMQNKYFHTYSGHKFNDTIPVFSHYYHSPFASSGDYQIWYSKKDSTVISLYLGN